MAAFDERLHHLQTWTLLSEPGPKVPIKYTSKKASFWRVGRVFMFPYSETVGVTAFLTHYNPDEFIQGRNYGSWIHQKARIFVVISVEHLYCKVLPIATHGKQGVAKQGVNKSHYGGIYTGKGPIYISEAEAACPGLFQPHSIRVVEDEKTIRLHPMSRINYDQVQPVQRNVAVKSVGMVHEDSLPHLMEQFRNVISASLLPSNDSTGYHQPSPSIMMACYTYEAESAPHFPSNIVDSSSGDHVSIYGPPHRPSALLSAPYPVSYEAIQSTAAQTYRAVGDGSPQLHSNPFNPDTTDIPRHMHYGRRRRGSRNPGPLHPIPRYGG